MVTVMSLLLWWLLGGVVWSWEQVCQLRFLVPVVTTLYGWLMGMAHFIDSGWSRTGSGDDCSLLPTISPSFERSQFPSNQVNTCLAFPSSQVRFHHPKNCTPQKTIWGGQHLGNTLPWSVLYLAPERTWNCKSRFSFSRICPIESVTIYHKQPESLEHSRTFAWELSKGKTGLADHLKWTGLDTSTFKSYIERANLNTNNPSQIFKKFRHGLPSQFHDDHGLADH